MKPNTNIHIPESIKRALKSKAYAEGLTMNSAILTAIMSYLKEKK